VSDLVYNVKTTIRGDNLRIVSDFSGSLLGFDRKRSVDVFSEMCGMMCLHQTWKKSPTLTGSFLGGVGKRKVANERVSIAYSSSEEPWRAWFSIVHLQSENCGIGERQAP
jgi:hypothetical protein